MRWASMSLRIQGSWALRSSGIGLRFALYSAYWSLRTVSPETSRAMPTSSGSSSRRSLRSMFKNPQTALVGSPFELESSRMA